MKKPFRTTSFSVFVSLGIVFFLGGPLFADSHESSENGEHANVLAVIGGSTIDRRHVGDFFGDGVAVEEDKFTVETGAGTSPTIYRMRYKDVPYYYVRYHGFPDVDARESGGSNFVTMFAAFHKLGVTHIIGGATCGGMQPTYRNGDLIVSSDILNLNYERPSSVLVAGKIQRPGIRPVFNPPVCTDIHDLLYELAVDNYKVGRVYPEGVIMQDDASRYETPAEIRMYRAMGGDIVTHNVVTEIIYARQLGMHMAVVNAVSNPAVGVRPFTREEEYGVGDKVAEALEPILFEALERLYHHKPKCGVVCEGEGFGGK